MASEKKIILPLIKEARTFTLKTDQKKICKLIAKVSDAEFWNPSCPILVRFHQCLSSALTGIYNSNSGWLSRLNAELDEISKII